MTEIYRHPDLGFIPGATPMIAAPVNAQQTAAQPMRGLNASRMTHPIMAQFHDQPALVAPEHAGMFESLLTDMVAAPDFAMISDPKMAASDDFWDEDWSWVRPYDVRDGVLTIPVRGVLLNGFPFQFGGWATGYEYIRRAYDRGMADGNVNGIAFVINSPGGTVAECFDACDKMIAGKTKPVRAFAAESAYSAAYAVACVADTIAVSRTGGVGSVGVVTMHVDYSAAMAEAGIKVTYVHAGKYKVEGNPYEKLSAEARTRIQERIDDMYAIFVDHVATGRGMEPDAVRATEALCFSANTAVSNGLADSVGALDDSLAAFVAELSNTPETGDDDMSTTQGNSAEQASTEQTIDTAAIASEAREAEQQRIAAILGCDEAEGRETLAKHLAFNTSLSADEAATMLAASEKKVEAQTDPATPFAAAMDAQEQPEVGGGNASASNDDEDSADSIVALAARVGIKGFAKRDA